MKVKTVHEQTTEATVITIATASKTFTIKEHHGALVIQGSGPLFVQWRGENEAMIDSIGAVNEAQSQS